MEMKICKNCGVELNGKFCSNCGQKVYSEKDKSISNLIHETFHFMTHFDGKIINTLKTIYLNPSKLSSDYSKGIRQKYYAPISLYLLIVVLYLLFPLADGMNMKMKYYKTTPIMGEYIGNLIEKKSISENLSEEKLGAKFDEKSKNTSKFLLILLIPLSAPLLYMLYFKKKRFIFDNFILLTEINIFFFLSFFFILPVLIFPLLYIFSVSIFDDIAVTLSIIIFSIYYIILLLKIFIVKYWITVLNDIFFAVEIPKEVAFTYRTIVFITTFSLI